MSESGDVETEEHPKEGVDKELPCSVESNADSKGKEEDGQAKVLLRDVESGELLREEEEISPNVRWELVGSGDVSETFRAVFEKGRKLCEEGKMEEAVVLFDKCVEVNPQWPYPLYERAWCMLLMKRPADALICYRKVMKLCPRGFFNASTALDSLTRELIDQNVAHGMYLATLTIVEMMEGSQKQKGELLLNIIRSKGGALLPVTWLHLSKYLAEPGQQLFCLEKGLGLKPDDGTKCKMLIERALCLWNHKTGNSAEAKKILHEIVKDEQSPLAATMQAKWLLAEMSKKEEKIDSK